MPVTARRLSLCALALFAAAVFEAAFGAVYLPLPDRDLAQLSPVIAVARVVDQRVTLLPVNGQDSPFTITTFETLEILKGAVPDSFDVRLPGGVAGGVAWQVPGTPEFQKDAQVILFLAPLDRASAVYRLTEFGLSKFDIAEDASGQKFAVRPAFAAEADDYLSGRSAAPGTESAAAATGPKALRSLDTFLAALRALARGEEPTEIRYPTVQGSLRASSAGARPLWVNIGGREGSSGCGVPCLFRWFWDTGASPNGVVFVTGSQTSLSDGSNGVTHVQNAVDKWHGVAGTDIRYSGVSGSGTVNVKLDKSVSDDGTSWTTPFGCTGGLLGLGGPDLSPPAPAFKGDGNYYAIQAGTVQMRKINCITGYPAAVFRSAVLHEMGHTLGLGHPDEGSSTHSTTTVVDWNTAVMHSVIPATYPDTPQTDDVQAVQFYYGTGGGGSPCVVNTTTLCLNGGRFKVVVAWTKPDGTSGVGQAIALTGDTGYFWFFSSNNVEMVIKVVDGRALNSRYWTFAAGLTNVNVVITVTDSQTGAVKTYVNPQGIAFAPIQDTSAFAGSTVPDGSFAAPSISKAAVSAGLEGLLEGRAAVVERMSPSAAEAVCVANATTLCLNGGRFKVVVAWTKSDGTSGAGQAVTLTGDTGYFWFFSSNNVEMVIKVVDGRPVNNRYWTFAAGLTNVNVVITVTDSQTGAVQNYVNPQGVAFAPIQDTNAFPGP